MARARSDSERYAQGTKNALDSLGESFKLDFSAEQDGRTVTFSYNSEQYSIKFGRASKQQQAKLEKLADNDGDDEKWEEVSKLNPDFKADGTEQDYIAFIKKILTQSTNRK